LVKLTEFLVGQPRELGVANLVEEHCGTWAVLTVETIRESFAVVKTGKETNNSLVDVLVF